MARFHQCLISGVAMLLLAHYFLGLFGLCLLHWFMFCCVFFNRDDTAAIAVAYSGICTSLVNAGWVDELFQMLQCVLLIQFVQTLFVKFIFRTFAFLLISNEKQWRLGKENRISVVIQRLHAVFWIRRKRLVSFCTWSNLLSKACQCCSAFEIAWETVLQHWLVSAFVIIDLATTCK